MAALGALAVSIDMLCHILSLVYSVTFSTDDGLSYSVSLEPIKLEFTDLFQPMAIPPLVRREPLSNMQLLIICFHPRFLLIVCSKLSGSFLKPQNKGEL